MLRSNLRTFKPRFNGLKRFPLRTYSNYNYNYNYSQPYTRSNWKKWLVGTGIVSLVGYGVYYIYWPKHTFPSPVATLLRKGLWAESDKGENDYQLALKYYIEALEKCNELNMNPLVDEYTGIQLKIGEMFERLNMIDKALLIYNEIGSLYLKTLHDKSLKLNNDYRNHLIQKSLRIGVKLSELSKDDLNLSKAILIAHSSAATVEINNFINSASPMSKVDLVFLDEYINAINLLIAINIQLGDFSFAMDKTLKLYKLMKISHIEPKKFLLNICNLGGLSYLQSEIFELKLINLLKNHNLNPDIKNVDTSLLENDKETFDENLKFFNVYINYATEVYEFVLSRANELVKPQATANNASPLNEEEINDINEIIALSTYSLGVINLHLKNFDKAERLLRESRVKSKSCNYVDLINEIENELSKLFKERDLTMDK
ncbi:mitochondrial inner membrane i-AAA protease supercomplex subunit Mgr3p [[Candida] jaroonii]|uniref:Mitochondrial inner membrane i-AAA protease supercomplex subunit Mgr3p n=1 Tax=[Candida] jaroonii TaxID=467808 RepID=A0ACA9Y5U5_9ASCO|nr:mitochondrial inner membrane i-AAA protease supercomplex subunit Mgr3p [[Candida] jaroonii]